MMWVGGIYTETVEPIQLGYITTVLSRGSQNCLVAHGTARHLANQTTLTPSQVITKLHILVPLELLMPDTASEKGKGTKLYSLITENFQVPMGSHAAFVLTFHTF